MSRSKSPTAIIVAKYSLIGGLAVSIVALVGSLFHDKMAADLAQSAEARQDKREYEKAATTEVSKLVAASLEIAERQLKDIDLHVEDYDGGKQVIFLLRRKSARSDFSKECTALSTSRNQAALLTPNSVLALTDEIIRMTKTYQQLITNAVGRASRKSTYRLATGQEEGVQVLGIQIDGIRERYGTIPWTARMGPSIAKEKPYRYNFSAHFCFGDSPKIYQYTIWCYDGDDVTRLTPEEASAIINLHNKMADLRVRLLLEAKQALSVPTK